MSEVTPPAGFLESWLTNIERRATATNKLRNVLNVALGDESHRYTEVNANWGIDFSEVSHELLPPFLSGAYRSESPLYCLSLFPLEYPTPMDPYIYEGDSWKIIVMDTECYDVRAQALLDADQTEALSNDMQLLFPQTD